MYLFNANNVNHCYPVDYYHFIPGSCVWINNKYVFRIYIHGLKKTDKIPKLENIPDIMFTSKMDI